MRKAKETRSCNSCGMATHNRDVHSCPFCGMVLIAKSTRYEDVDQDENVDRDDLVKMIPQMSRENWEAAGRTYE